MLNHLSSAVTYECTFLCLSLFFSVFIDLSCCNHNKSSFVHIRLVYNLVQSSTHVLNCGKKNVGLTDFSFFKYTLSFRFSDINKSFDTCLLFLCTYWKIDCDPMGHQQQPCLEHQ